MASRRSRNISAFFDIDVRHKSPLIRKTKTAINSTRQHAKNKGYVSCITDMSTIISAWTGECVICKSTYRLQLDHCHTSGKFRGWICRDCNAKVGAAEAGYISIQSVVDYIRAAAEEMQLVNDKPIETREERPKAPSILDG